MRRPDNFQLLSLSLLLSLLPSGCDQPSPATTATPATTAAPLSTATKTLTPTLIPTSIPTETPTPQPTATEATLNLNIEGYGSAIIDRSNFYTGLDGEQRAFFVDQYGNTRIIEKTGDTWAEMKLFTGKTYTEFEIKNFRFNPEEIEEIVGSLPNAKLSLLLKPIETRTGESGTENIFSNEIIMGLPVLMLLSEDTQLFSDIAKLNSKVAEQYVGRKVLLLPTLVPLVRAADNLKDIGNYRFVFRVLGLENYGIYDQDSLPRLLLHHQKEWEDFLKRKTLSSEDLVRPLSIDSFIKVGMQEGDIAEIGNIDRFNFTRAEADIMTIMASILYKMTVALLTNDDSFQIYLDQFVGLTSLVRIY